ncbi:MAG: hypothetical protein JWM11_6396 [Planctomycetaceae bacterium]|nr:hypothetical protein [Planctomycetaceae bacterium]
MIDVKTEQMEPLDTVKIIGNPSRPTRYRWALQGVGDPAVVLESLTIGGRKWTSVQAVQRFYAAQNVDRRPEPSVTPSHRQREGRAAMRKLAECGVGAGCDGE